MNDTLFDKAFVKVKLLSTIFRTNEKTDKDKNYYEAKCSGLDRQIDRLVYELYGLTDEEIKIVEGNASL